LGENPIPLSELSEKYQIHPNDLYRWKKQLFEGAAETFKKPQNGKVSSDERKMEQLKEKLKSKDSLYRRLSKKTSVLKKG